MSATMLSPQDCQQQVSASSASKAHSGTVTWTAALLEAACGACRQPAPPAPHPGTAGSLQGRCLRHVQPAQPRLPPSRAASAAAAHAGLSRLTQAQGQLRQPGCKTAAPENVSSVQALALCRLENLLVVADMWVPAQLLPLTCAVLHQSCTSPARAPASSCPGLQASRLLRLRCPGWPAPLRRCWPPGAACATRQSAPAAARCCLPAAAPGQTARQRTGSEWRLQYDRVSRGERPSCWSVVRVTGWYQAGHMCNVHVDLHVCHAMWHSASVRHRNTGAPMETCLPCRSCPLAGRQQQQSGPRPPVAAQRLRQPLAVCGADAAW